MQEKFTNSLITSSSPYLLQHAHNPVHWHPWKKEVLQKAQEADKLLLVSIGYAACHWCHVMEKESFKDEVVAAIMNEHFINIKVDREERPDIDHIYMNAVQLMTGGGGWPLNVVALPDGRPVWGGTYFKKEQWMSILQQLAGLHKIRPAQLLEYAQRLEEGLQYTFPVISISEKNRITLKNIKEAVSRWSAYFDTEYGGTRRAPKFMMPVHLGFLLHYAVRCNDKRILTHVEATLTKMAYGGIYDQLGGGFSRYSVDEKWHIPHFEKMLYDNAQLVIVYSDAYRLTKNDLYREVVEKTLDFIARELTHARGAFFSSLDADSLNEAGESEEGAFYVWKKSELQRLLKEDFPLFARYYNINDVGYWEEEKYVLIRTASEDEIAVAHRCTVREVKAGIDRCNRILFEARERRSKPGLDDKTLTSWNALMLQGYVAAYKAFEKEEFLHRAVKNAGFLMEQQTTGDGGLYHSFKAGKSTVNGFLEDYAAACEAFIALYEVSGEEKWLLQARQWVDYCYDYFYDEKSGFFFFTSHREEVMFTRTVETDDNVIPASNSILAKVLFKLSRYVENDRYAKTAEQMLLQLKDKILAYPYSYANWLELALYLNGDFYEVAISGERAKDLVKEFTRHYLPHVLIAAGEMASRLPLLKDRYVSGETLIYVCKDKSCQLPVRTAGEALEQISRLGGTEK